MQSSTARSSIQGALTINGGGQINGGFEVTGKLTAGSFAGDAAELSNVTPADGSVTNAKLAKDAASLTKVTGGSMVVSDGKLAIGTENPISKLHIRSAAGDVLPPRLEASAPKASPLAGTFIMGKRGKGYVGVPGAADRARAGGNAGLRVGGNQALAVGVSK